MRSIRELSVAEASYLAGLVDGEGTITLSRRHARDQRQLVLSISNTEPRILNWVRETVGAGKITRKRAVSAAHATGLTFAICNRQALSLIKHICPFLQSYKRERALLVLRDYVRLTPRNGKYSIDVAAQRGRFEQELLAIRAR